MLRARVATAASALALAFCGLAGVHLSSAAGPGVAAGPMSRPPLPVPPVPRNAGPHVRISNAQIAQLLSQNLAGMPRVGGTWNDIGPSSLSFGSLNSGRVDSLAYDTPLSTLFVGTANGGVWKSQSPFTTWTPLTDSMPDLAIGALAVDPKDPTGNTIYAGTGEANAGGDNKYGAGVYKTTDGGATWTQEGAKAFGARTISRLVVDPVTGDAYAAAESPFGGGGLFMSADHGVTWTNNSNLQNDSVADVQIDNLGDVYAAVGANNSTQTDNGVWQCAPACAAQPTPTFTEISSGLPTGTAGANYRLALADPADAPGSQTLYALVSDGSDVNHVLGLYRATSAGNPVSPASWTQIGSKTSFDTYEQQSWYDFTIFAPDPADVYVSLESIYKITAANTGNPVFTDIACVYGNGVGSGNPGYCQGGNTVGVHTDQHAIAPGPSGSTFFGNDGGVWDTTDGGNTWNDLNGNLSTMQFYGGALGTAPTTSGGPCTPGLCDTTLATGGLQDNGQVETSSTIGVNWQGVYGGDAFYSAIDPKDNNFQFEEYSDGRITGTTDNWNTNFDGNSTMCGAGSNNDNFSAPMLEDPANPATLLSGNLSLCESTNATSGNPTWTDISGKTTSTAISALALSHAGGGTAIYMSDNQGHSWFTTDNGTSWHLMDAIACNSVSDGPNCAVPSAVMGGMTPTACFCVTVQALAADPTTPGLIYAVVNGYLAGSPGHVFRGQVDFTSNTVAWTDISNNLPNLPYFTIAINPAHLNTLYVGSDHGVFLTVNDQNATPSWSLMGSGLPNSDVFNLQISPNGNRLVAFTYGRSAWQFSTTPTAAAYSALTAHRSAGVTRLTWRSTIPVLGFNVYDGASRVNRHLIAGTRGRYSFTTHRALQHPRLQPVYRG